MLYSHFSFSQSSISLSGHGGLVAVDGDYGNTISAKAGLLMSDSFGIEIAYNYIKVENNNDNNFYNVNRYALLSEQFIFSDDKTFRVSGKLGPSLAVYNNSENDRTLFGLDFGIESSLKLFDLFYIDLGLINTINKNKLMTQLYVGLSYDISFKNRDK